VAVGVVPALVTVGVVPALVAVGVVPVLVAVGVAPVAVAVGGAPVVVALGVAGVAVRVAVAIAVTLADGLRVAVCRADAVDVAVRVGGAGELVAVALGVTDGVVIGEALAVMVGTAVAVSVATISVPVELAVAVAGTGSALAAATRSAAETWPSPFSSAVGHVSTAANRVSITAAIRSLRVMPPQIAAAGATGAAKPASATAAQTISRARRGTGEVMLHPGSCGATPHRKLVRRAGGSPPR
jgi:hypothetical protein